MIFSELNILPALVKTLEKLGYTAPTPVQKEVIPKILQGLDLRVSAPTGTGKTAAFLLPIITQLMKKAPSVKGKNKGPRALILVPTRELALQVASQAEKYSNKLHPMKVVCIYGGVSYHRQNKDLMRHHEIIVATPGRFIDHLERGRISLERIETFILDEADRMLDMGFSEPVQQIADELPTDRKTLLFSATLKGNVLKLSKKLLTKPLEVNIAAEVDKQENIDQSLYYVDDIHHKQTILNHLLDNTEIQQAVIFTATKRQVEKLTKILLEMDYLAEKLHGDMNQRQRTKTINQLRKGKINILVATDVAARGIDVKTISHVINFDLPSTPEDYVHRIGRTARAGAKGTSFSFATRHEHALVSSIEQYTKKSMTSVVIPGLEPKKKVKQQRPPSRKPTFKRKKTFARGKPRKPRENSKKTKRFPKK